MQARKPDHDTNTPRALRRAARRRARPRTDPEGVRTALVRRARSRLAAGFYDLPELVEAAIDRLIDIRDIAP